VSPDGRTKYQIDHTLVNGRFRTSVLDMRAMRSDHFLVRSTIRLELKSSPVRKNTSKRFDTQKLQNHDTHRRFTIQLKNRFQALAVEEQLTDEGEEQEDQVDRFVYLGATVSKERGGTENIDNRVVKARGVFLRLKNICSSHSISRLYKTLVKPVLMYGCET